MFPRNNILVIMGATASGKSDLALEFAERFDGEIVSADSMQIYRGLAIGTAKPDPEQLARVPHHLISTFPVSQKTDVYLFRELATRAIREIHTRARLPVVVGGTGFYLRTLLYGLDELPGDTNLRAELDQRYDHPAGFEELKQLMQRCDPDDLARWEKHRRKLIRALEVFTLTGKSITQLQTLRQPELKFNATVWHLLWERDEQKKRIAKRTDRMLESGWIEEAEQAINNGLLNTPTARQALGYRIIGDFLDGLISRDEMRERIITATWQFARRQLSWFRHQHPEARIIHMPITIDRILTEM